MIYYLIANGGITIVYLLIILSFIKGWGKMPVYQKGSSIPSDIFLSLIIALRNEEQNIQNLINSLLSQSLDKSKFEIILVDDHSTDKTYQLCNILIRNFPHIKIFKLTIKSGKKQALSFGIKNSKGQLIVTTDADCIHHKEWLETIYEFYLEFKPQMISGPVIMSAKSFFEKIQAIDFFSLIVSGAGAIGIHRPIMCNGANLAFEKESFEAFANPYNEHIISGEDIFLLLNIKKAYPHKILFIKSKEATVYTKAEHTFKQFLNQRKRWASKSKAYKDKDIIITAVIVLFINILILANLLTSLILSQFIIVFLVQFLLKSIVDFIFLARTNQFFKYKKLLWYFIPAQLFNILILPFIAIVGIMGSVKWKGRI